MVKVTIRRIRTGLAGASGLFLLGQLEAGCASPIGGESVSATRSADTTIDPGTGTLTLAPTWSSPGLHYAFSVTGSVDEYLRVGQVVTFDLSAYDLWSAIHPDESAPGDPTLITALTPTFEIRFIGKGDVLGTATTSVRWNVAAPWAVTGTSTPFTIPAGTDTLEFGLVIVDATDGSRVELSDLDFQTLPVFGAELPLKHALFDNDGAGDLRTRVVEGGALVQAGQVDVAFTDWRADEIVQKTLLDLEIGTAQSYGRFGPIVVPIYGSITYQVSVGFAFDDGYWSEWPMTANSSPRVLDLPGRTAYESTIWLNEGVTAMNLYFHVKAYLNVDYTAYGTNVVTKKYAQGDRVLLREAWDNANGTAGANYVIPVAATSP